MASCEAIVYHVYIMAGMSNTHPVLYSGVTGNIAKRVRQHKQHLKPGFTKRYNAIHLVYVEPFNDVRAAIAREKQIKGWRREKKLELIQAHNPRWKDLGAMGAG